MRKDIILILNKYLVAERSSFRRKVVFSQHKTQYPLTSQKRSMWVINIANPARNHLKRYNVT